MWMTYRKTLFMLKWVFLLQTLRSEAAASLADPSYEVNVAGELQSPITKGFQHLATTVLHSIYIL